MYRYDEIDALIDDLDDVDEFKAPFRIKTRLPSTRIFPVTGGKVTVTTRSTRWDRPSACPIRSFTVRLWRNVDWWFDDNHGARTFPVVAGSHTETWTGLPAGDYYLEIDVGSTNPNCVLSGEIEVT